MLRDDDRSLITVMLAVKDAPAAVAWYKRALGATELWNLGSVAGLEVQGAPFLVGEPESNGWEAPAVLGMPSARVEVFCDDPDALVERAIEEGAEGKRDPIRNHDMPWGVHRQGGFVDPFGHVWLVGDKSPLRPLTTARTGGKNVAKVQVRYVVRDVEAAIVFYTERLGFHLDMHPAPPFAMLSRGELRLVLSAPNPSAGGGRPMPDGTEQTPGGWNRFAVQVEDLAATVLALRQAGARFRNDVVTGVGGKQIIVEDPSGNPVELFQPTIAEARLE